MIGASIIVLSVFLNFLFLANATDVSNLKESPPEWIDSQSRAIIGGDILHVGIGYGGSPETARFKAEAMAVKALISECSLAHKDIIIWDRYLIIKGDKSFAAYARAGLAYQQCQEAKNAKGDLRRQLSSEILIRNQDLYDKLEFAISEDDSNSVYAKMKSWVIGERSSSDKKVKELEARVELIEQKPAGTVKIVENKTVNVFVGSEASKKERLQNCMNDYNELMREAQDKSIQIRKPGSMSTSETAPLFARAMRKLSFCNQIK